jgi:hypothetical protein
MKTYCYAPDLKIGDLIMVSYDNYMMHGIFVGHGRNTIQYYSPTWLVKRAEKGIKSYVDYIKDDRTRICKISPDILNEEDRATYEKAMEILKINK